MIKNFGIVLCYASLGMADVHYPFGIFNCIFNKLWFVQYTFIYNKRLDLGFDMGINEISDVSIFGNYFQLSLKTTLATSSWSIPAL